MLLRINNHCVSTDNKTYECKDGNALIIDKNLALLCPPNVLRSSSDPIILNRMSSLLPVTRVGMSLS